MKPGDVGKTLVEQALARLPEAQRAAAAAIFADPNAAPALELIGGGVLMREDHSRLMNETDQAKKQADALLATLRTKETEQNAWWATAQEDVELGRTARKANWKPGDPDPNNPNPNPSLRTAPGLTHEDVNKLMTDREVGQALFVTALTDLSSQHVKRFGEVLDTKALVKEVMTDPAARERGLEGHYQFKYRDQIATATKAAADADFEARYQERFKVDVAKYSSNPPYPVGGRAAEDTSPLGALEPAKPTQGDASVQAAVDLYNQLTTANAGR